MRLSVLLPWRDRDELGESLPRNLAEFDAANAELIVINVGGDAARLRRLLGGQEGRRVFVVELGGAEVFNRAQALNIGAEVCRGDCLFALDVDVLLPPGFFAELLPPVTKGGCFVSVREVAESNPALQPDRWNPKAFITGRTLTTEMSCENGRTASLHFRLARDGTRSGSGLILARRDHAIAVDGFNGGLEGWGFEDYDMHLRLQFALGLRRLELGRVVHLSHTKVRDAAVSNARNFESCQANYDRGHFLGTMRDDVTMWRTALRDHLQELPTESRETT